MKTAKRTYLVYCFISSLLMLMVFTVSSVYFVTAARLTPLQLVLLGTALETSIFVFEIPTGIVADLYSRRLSVIIGVFLIGMGFLLEGAFAAFLPLVISQVLWGLGYTFTSGALQAWISDEIGEENAASAFLRGAQVDQIGGLIGIGLGTALGSLRLNLPILLSGALFIPLGIYLMLHMPETGFHPLPAQDRSTWQKMWRTFRTGLGMVRLRPALVGILGIGLFYGLYSEGFDRLWVAHALQRFSLPQIPGLQPVFWFGALSAVAMLINIFANQALQRRLNRPSSRQLGRIMAASTGLLVLSLAAFALVRHFWLAIGLYLAISALRHINDPVYTAWVNHRLDPQVRATVLSFSSQVDALGQIAGGPLVGVIAQQTNLQIGLLLSAGLLAPSLLLFGMQIRGDLDRNPRQSAD